ncbi:gamma-glutamyl hydrolase-like [Hydractinia symbiolongicarpus]|uniref:gamma-glutamyl hydrolase-like n=1 Tax=Hydractinia symbiolongicarpus TaxID=13093 RepID=UPI002550A820|nr:gamma-glutamyl hydrolase-like [Hydractinia symbiolongicarpus]
MADTKRIEFLIFLLISSFACFFSSKEPNKEVNERPIVGVVVMDIIDAVLLKTYPNLRGKHFVPASYVKLIEMTGARLVPISSKMSNEKVKTIFNSVNGLLFPGAGNNLNHSGYHNVTKKLFELSMTANKNGEVFPILGICRGFQALIVHVEGNESPIIATDSQDYPATVRWNRKSLKNSFLSSMPKMMIQYSEKHPITAHFHKYSITSDFFKRSSKLNNFFDILATSLDRNGTEFVSAMEGKKFPFYGIQFHPEKTMFEWSTTVSIPHSPQAIQLGQFIANSFMEQVRRNKRHFFKSSMEREYVIEKYHLMRIDDIDGHAPFQEIYII